MVHISIGSHRELCDSASGLAQFASSELKRRSVSCADVSWPGAEDSGHHTPPFEAKAALEVARGEKAITEISRKYGVHTNHMWAREVKAEVVERRSRTHLMATEW
jgi:hypothetical protein